GTRPPGSRAASRTGGTPPSARAGAAVLLPRRARLLTRPLTRRLTRRRRTVRRTGPPAADRTSGARAREPPVLLGPDHARVLATLKPVTEDVTTTSLPEQMWVRREKLERLRKEGIDPYPVNFPRTTTIAEVREKHQGLPPDTATGERVGVTGRVMLLRTSGKLCFATIRDGTAAMQIMLSLDRVGEEALARWKRDIDLGDHVGVEGEVVTSRRGELSVMVDRWALTSKCLRPLPDKHKGLTDPEARVRMRYVDLIVNDEARRMAYLRSETVRAVRDFWHEEGYLEVETLMLQPIHGGAAARPFKTHIN